MLYVYSFESLHWGDCIEYIKHTLIQFKIKKAYLIDPHLPPDLAPWLTFSGYLSKWPLF